MGSSRPWSIILTILNALQIIFAFVLVGISVWFYVEVQSVTGLRNPSRNLLNYDVYWPQVVPWVFLIIGAILLLVSCCGVAGARNRSKPLINTYVVFEVIMIVLLIGAAACAFVFADSNNTEQFVQRTFVDVFGETVTKPDVASAYNNFESRYKCCAMNNALDYQNKRPTLPKSCCGGEVECDISDTFANQRLGCSIVAVNYTKMAIKILAATSAFTALLAIISMIVGVMLYSSMRKGPKMVVEYHETESKKVLL